MIVSIAYFILYFFIFLVLLGLLVLHRQKYRYKPTHHPKVSILIAARNEEHTILRCLQAISQLHYPAELIEVLIGDDASTDATRAVVEAYIRDKPHYACITIQQNIGNAKGKANVLAQLAKHATSDYYFFTDADIAVPPTWIEGMLAQLTEKVGVVTGITTISGNSFFAKLQFMDWLYALGLMQIVSDLGLPVTTMGNNMLLRRSAYEQVGGFEGIKFSVTEDIAIFNQVLRRGWGFRNVFDKSVMALSTPAEDIGALLRQRHRWMRGTFHLPFYMVVILVIHASYYPVLLPFFLYTPVAMVLAVFALKLALQSLFIYLCLRRLEQTAPWWLYIMFELYYIISSVLLIIYFFLPMKIRWKGRKF